MSKKKILIVDDDAEIKLGLHSALIDEGYEVHAASNGPNGFRIAEEENPDLIILDMMPPGMNGYNICKKVRDKGIESPIIMLTAKISENDTALGLESGVVDYVLKPFNIGELMARVKANLRRHETANKAQNSGANGASDELHKFAFGETVVDLKRHEVYKAGKRQDVTNREFKLLEYFIHHPGEVLTRNRLLDEIWGYNIYPATRTVDNHILRLRKHVESNPDEPVFIKTVRGAGYLFNLG